MNIFKSYKTQYTEAVAQVDQLKVELEQANAQITDLKAKVGLGINKDDYEKLMSEHADFAKKNIELAEVIEKMKAEKVDVETLANKKAQSILADVGVERPFSVAEEKDEAEDDRNFTLDGKKYRVFTK